jgi:hypothetical protein
MQEKLIESNRTKIIKGISIIIISSIACVILTVILISIFLLNSSEGHWFDGFPSNFIWFIPFISVIRDIFIVWGVWLTTCKFFPDSNKLILISGRLLRIISVFYLLISMIKVITIMRCIPEAVNTVFGFAWPIFFVTGFFYLATLLYSANRHVLALLACCFIAYKILWWTLLGSDIYNLFFGVDIFNGIITFFFLLSASSTVKKYAS